METQGRFIQFNAVVALLAICVAAANTHVQAAPNSFLEGACLYNTAFDSNINWQYGSGTGDWGPYKSWLGASQLEAEGDPGYSAGDWYDCCQNTTWNSGWGTMQQRYGTGMPDVFLGIGQMPWASTWDGSNPPDSTHLNWENQEWALEAGNDPGTMAYFANYAKEVDNGFSGDSAFNSVVIRIGLEFDGNWFPWGNLPLMSNMPTNYIKAWQNIVNTMRANDPKHIIKFCWNPTDEQTWYNGTPINAMSYYPGDSYVDYIGIDEYDTDNSSGVYPYDQQPTLAQQLQEWPYEAARLNNFVTFASSSNTSRYGYVSGTTKPIIMCEWGLVQINNNYTRAGGDNPTYVQNMHDWMANPNNHVYAESYFDIPESGSTATNWGQGNNPALQGGATYPDASAVYMQLFGPAGGGSSNTHSGIYSLKGSLTGSWAGATEFPNVAQYQTYTASFWAKGSGQICLRVLNGNWGTLVSSQIFTLTSNWTQYSITAATGSNTMMTFNLADVAAGTAYVDDCYFGTVNGANLLSNAGFEIPNMAWTVGGPWSIPVPNTHSGAYALKGNLTASWSGMCQYTTSTQNQTYTASVWAKGSGQIYLRVCDGIWGTQVAGQSFTLTSNWTKYSVTAPTGGNSTMTFALSDAAAGTAYIDDCFFGIANGANTLLNPSFESGGASWSVGGPWSIQELP